MEVLVENIIIYSLIGMLFGLIFWFYLRKQKKRSREVEEKIRIAKKEGVHEPVSMHPVVDPNACINSGACIAACPTQAITLCIGTEKHGVDLPHVDQFFETNVSGIYIAGEMGGMGLIRNAVEQGKQAVENLQKTIDRKVAADYDLIIIGAGPAGISASLAAKKLKLSALTLEQDSLGGTVFTFPRSKIVMTSPMDLPLHGKVRLFETSKSKLLYP